MLILSIRTDKPEAELGLFDNDQQLGYETWPAHRELSNAIHKKLGELLDLHGKKLADLQGIVCFKGPGGFTGLRIGLTVGNALAYGLSIPIVGAMGDDWLATGRQKLANGENEKSTFPEYGAEAHITVQKR